jgi:hypothetical protein
MISSSFGGTSGWKRASGTGARFQDRFGDHTGSVPGKGRAAGSHLIEDQAEREQVGAGVEFFAAPARAT